MAMTLYREIRHCRSCNGDRLDTVVDLGTQAISDFPERVFEADAVVEEYDRAPLTLVRCNDCTLVQLAHTVDRERLYRRYYYKSGTNESMVAALKDVVDDAVSRVGLDDREWLDIGANDGTLMDLVPKGGNGGGVHGIDPAPQGHGIHKDYFPSKTMWRHKFKVITSIAQFYNVDDVNGYVAEIKRILHPEGIWVVQMMDVASMLRQRAFDNICHEHLTYWSYKAFSRLVEQHGLFVVSQSYNDVNGGSVRFIVKHSGGTKITGLLPTHSEDWTAFREDVQALKVSTLALLGDLACKVGGYGASTKFSTMAQFYGLGPDLIPYVADRNPEKWGRTTVTGIPIISEEEMRWREPDMLFVGPWHFLDAFKEREAAFLARGGQFIVPLPVLRIVGGSALAGVRESVAA